MQAFDPGESTTIIQANATGSAGGSLPDSVAQVVLYNSSATATVYWTCRKLNGPADTGPTAAIPTSGNPGAMPIPPGDMIRITVGRGPKKYATIASAADGDLFITPGEGI
jgi:hypothetical protein